MKARTRAMTIAGLALGLLLGSVPASEAAHHLVKLRQVSYGNSENASAEFVVLQLTGQNENLFGSAVSVRLYGANGTQTNIATSAGNPPIGTNQAAVLVATANAESAYTADADMQLPNVDALDSAGGAVCLTSSAGFGPLDCVGWGSLTNTFAAPSPIGTLEPAIPENMILDRSIAANCPTMHDFADDTNDSANDFATAAISQPLRENDSAIPETPCRNLTVSRIGTGTGTVTGPGISCPSDCFGQYVTNDLVTLTATPATGSTFGGFTPNCAPFGVDQCTITMSTNATVTATFNGPPAGTGPATPTPPATKKKCKKGRKLKKGKCVKKKRK